jgi:hypothetical protein
VRAAQSLWKRLQGCCGGGSRSGTRVNKLASWDFRFNTNTSQLLCSGSVLSRRPILASQLLLGKLFSWLIDIFASQWGSKGTQTIHPRNLTSTANRQRFAQDLPRNRPRAAHLAHQTRNRPSRNALPAPTLSNRLFYLAIPSCSRARRRQSRNPHALLPSPPPSGTGHRARLCI